MSDETWDKMWSEIETDRQDRYEEAAVRQILKWYKLKDLEQQILDWVCRIWGEPKLTLAAFQELTGFPVYLASRKVPWLDGLEQDLEERPSKTSIFRFFAEIVEEKPEGCYAAALLFPWPRHGKFYALHDIQTWPEQSTAGRFWVLGKPPLRYWLQELKDFLPLVFVQDLAVFAKTEE